MEKLAEFFVAVGAQATPPWLANIKKHIDYLIKYKENLKNLKEVGDQLDAKRTDERRFLNDTDTKFKDVSSTTTLWKSKADELHKKVQAIFSVNNVLCLNLWSRYSLSKQACELTQEINQNLEKAPDFGTTFDRPTPELGATFNLKGFVEFGSRLKVLNEVVEALKDAELSMCSVCGMGGTGKTMLAKKLIQRVESDHLFDKVAMVTVSQIVKLEAIQKEIIEQLGLKMVVETTKARAKNLILWLGNNNTLLILDDVWWQLSDEDFENVGIPLGSKRCKIVLTSRNEDECKKMGSQRNFRIGVLEHKEARDLFRLYAGKCAGNSNLQDTAMKIADECDGLPIAIITIATSLKDKPVSVWNDSLRQLQNSSLERVLGMEKVYSRIRLSYDLLKDNEAQTIFCLCCLFPEDYNVPVEDHLLFSGKGLELFENVDSISEARDRVQAIIHKLKKSFLLLDGIDDRFVKMHDLMRDFAISISSDSCLVKHGNEMIKWPDRSRYENCSAISLGFEKVKEHPVGLRCPKLKLLQLSFKIGSAELPIGFFEGMKELKVLLLQVPCQSLSFGTLKELRTLLIYDNLHPWDETNAPKIGDLVGYGDLKCLEIFKLEAARPWNDFPTEIRLLCNLRYLDFHRVKFKYMPPNVLSKLVKLEELLLPGDFKNWGCKEEDGERVNASLDEIESLPLTRLGIGMKEGSSLGEKLVRNLRIFFLSIGCKKNFDWGHVFENWMDLSDVDASIFTTSWMISLLPKLELLILRNMINLKNLMLLAGSLRLKILAIFFCKELECFVTTNVQAPRFNNVRRIEIHKCSNLKYMFPLSVARELRQLQRMDIQRCKELEEIFFSNNRNHVENNFPPLSLQSPPPVPYIGGSRRKGKQHKMVSNQQIPEIYVPGDDDAIASQIVFPQLRELVLGWNSKLRVVYDGNEAIELPLLEDVLIVCCENIEAFSYGSLNAPNLKQIILDGTNYKDGVEDLNEFLKEKKLDREKLDSNEEINEEKNEGKDD